MPLTVLAFPACFAKETMLPAIAGVLLATTAISVAPPRAVISRSLPRALPVLATGSK
jgi:hypothetical protein